MIEILTLLTGIILAQASPGPNMMAVAAASLGTGRQTGVATALGIASGVFLWSLLFFVGVGALLTTFPESLILLRFLGGGYLLYLGLRSLRSLFTQGSTPDAGPAGTTLPLAAAWRRGLLVVMTNPKAALMWIAISLFLAGGGHPAASFILTGIAASLSAAVIYGLYAVLFSTGVAVRGYRRMFRLVDGLFGLVFGALGGKLIADGLRELQSA